MAEKLSPYALVGPRLVDMGYSAVPIIPGTKAPGTMRASVAAPITEWRTRFNRKLPSDFEVTSWAKEDAGVGVVCGYNDLVAIDIDTADAIILRAIVAVLPETPVRKMGQKGETLFYRGPGVSSKSFDIPGPSGRPSRAVDIIGDGRQTLLPPTIHPDTNKPYMWIGERPLDEIAPEDLPELPADIADRIAEVLAPFGYEAMARKPNIRLAAEDGEVTPFQAVNSLAMGCFDAWVPRLSLYRLRVTRAGYEAVPTWRSSNSGRPLDRRKLNLKIHFNGIRDFGVPEEQGGYSPIDLVIAASGCDTDTAFKNLAEWTGWSTGEIIEVRKPAATPGVTDEAEQVASPAEEEPAAPPRPSLVFLYGHKQIAPPPWLIDGVLPQGELAILAGQSSAGKTFIGIDISFSVMTGAPFIDHTVVRPGGVLWLAAEGQSEVMIRLKAAALHRGGETMERKLPFAQQEFDVPSLTERGAKARLMALIDDAKAQFESEFPGCDLVLIVIDTLNGAAGFQDENSASETQRVMNTLREISTASGALVLMIDHHGKAEGTGIRGSSAKRGAADAVLSALAEKTGQGIIENRRLVVEKLRGAPTGRLVPFVLAPVDVDDAGNTHCAIIWSPQAAYRELIVPKSKLNPKSPWTGASRILRAAIEAVMDKASSIRPFGNEGPEVRAVRSDHVREEFYASYPAEDSGTKQKAFVRLTRKSAEDKIMGIREILGVDWYWIVKE